MKRKEGIEEIQKKVVLALEQSVTLQEQIKELEGKLDKKKELFKKYTATEIFGVTKDYFYLMSDEGLTDPDNDWGVILSLFGVLTLGTGFIIEPVMAALIDVIKAPLVAIHNTRKKCEVCREEISKIKNLKKELTGVKKSIKQSTEELTR